MDLALDISDSIQNSKISHQKKLDGGIIKESVCEGSCNCINAKSKLPRIQRKNEYALRSLFEEKPGCGNCVVKVIMKLDSIEKKEKLLSNYDISEKLLREKFNEYVENNYESLGGYMKLSKIIQTYQTNEKGEVWIGATLVHDNEIVALFDRDAFPALKKGIEERLQ